MSKPTLISFNVCPYVLRAVAFLHYKNLDYNIEYVELYPKPEWFLKISPFGKVPLLKIGDTVLFESNVILEYMDETNLPSLQPADPIQRALNRGYYTLSTDFLVALRQTFIAKDEAAFLLGKKSVQDLLDKLEKLLPSEGPFFNGKDLALIDFTFAPVFVQLQELQRNVNYNVFETTPKVNTYSDAIISLESVKKAKVPDFDDIYHNLIAKAYSPYYQTLVKQ